MLRKPQPKPPKPQPLCQEAVTEASGAADEKFKPKPRKANDEAAFMCMWSVDPTPSPSRSLSLSVRQPLLNFAVLLVRIRSPSDDRQPMTRQLLHTIHIE